MATNQPQKPNNGVKTEQVTPDLFNRFLDLQTEDLKLKQRELDFRARSDTNNFEYAKLALKEQANDKERQRSHDAKQVKLKYYFIVGIVVIMVGLLVFLIWNDKDQLVKEIITVLLGFVPGGIGGYAVGRSSSAHTNAPANSGTNQNP